MATLINAGGIPDSRTLALQYLKIISGVFAARNARASRSEMEREADVSRSVDQVNITFGISDKRSTWAYFAYRLYLVVDAQGGPAYPSGFETPLDNTPPFMNYAAVKEQMDIADTNYRKLLNFLAEARRQIKAGQEQTQAGPNLTDQSKTTAGQKRAPPSIYEEEEKEDPATKMVKQENKRDNKLLAEMAQSYVAEHGLDSLIELVRTPANMLCCPSSTPTISTAIHKALGEFRAYVQSCVDSSSLDWEKTEAMGTKWVVSLQKEGVPTEHVSHVGGNFESLMHAVFFKKIMRHGIEMNPARQWRNRVEEELAKRSKEPVQEEAGF